MQHKNCTPLFVLVPRCQVSRCPVSRFQFPARTSDKAALNRGIPYKTLRPTGVGNQWPVPTRPTVRVGRPHDTAGVSSEPLK